MRGSTQVRSTSNSLTDECLPVRASPNVALKGGALCRPTIPLLVQQMGRERPRRESRLPSRHPFGGRSRPDDLSGRTAHDLTSRS
jgi:hypothetical protein